MGNGSQPPLWEHMGDLLSTLTGDWRGTESEVWLWSVVASSFIGLAGVVPLLVLPSNYSSRAGKGDGQSNTMQLMLSFAVGGLLADVFLHLLPEAWTAALQAGLDPHEAFTRVGLCVLFGIFVFIIVEMLASGDGAASQPAVPTTAVHASTSRSNSDTKHNNGRTPHNNDHNSVKLSHNKAKISPSSDKVSHNNNNNNVNINTKSHSSRCSNITDAAHSGQLEYTEIERKIEVVGYLNLLANCIDNFAHGLAVAGSFMVSHKTGVLTTTAILIHEVPHEIGDFAILLSSGFTRWEAAKAQLYTATVGLMGAIFTLCLGSSSIVGCIQLYILGFTAGAFVNISLVSVLPKLLQENRPGHSAAQLMALLFGMFTMAALAC